MRLFYNTNFQRPEVSPLILNICVVTLLLSFYNNALWAKISLISESNSVATLAPYFLLFFFAFLFLTSLISVKYFHRATLALIILIASVINYFMSEYGIIIDKTMVQNAFETDAKEALELVSWGLIWHFIISGLTPVLVIFFVKIKTNSKSNNKFRKIIDSICSLALMIFVLVLFYKDFSMTFRENRDIRYLLTPSNYIYYGLRHLSGAYGPKDRSLQTILSDAEISKVENPKNDLAIERPDDTKTVTFIVIGETARSKNFSLNGYTRETNPLLGKTNAISFNNVSACGTSTAVSLPCMFSDLGRADFDPNKHRNRENILDVLQRLGIANYWRDNNSGCKGVCDRLFNADVSDFKNSLHCDDGNCFDEAMLDKLELLINKQAQHKIISLHQLGSHGPQYYKRYPEHASTFIPVCKESNIANCKKEEIVNAYDNTIIYTDYLLATLIESLKSQKKIASSIIYISDHGESLGENGIYLHGLPYFLAPQEQTKVPLIMWFSESYQEVFDIDTECLRKKSTKAYSHDNLFHSLLGLFNVSTSAYEKNLDIFSSCRQ